MNRYYRILFAFFCIALSALLSGQVVDEIYAVVNEEPITLWELQQFEQSMLMDMQSRLSGDELTKAQEEFQKNLLDLMINQKLIQSKLREKNYNVDAEIEMRIKEIKQQYSMSSDEELKQALQSQGMEYDKWREQMKEALKINRLKYEEIASKIKIDNGQIMEYYKKNPEKYTSPAEVTLNAIFLKKVEEGAPDTTQRDQISTELTAANFAEIAKKYSQLPDAAQSPLLGTFKEGELARDLDAQVKKMKVTEISGWIDSESGWYILQLVQKVDARLQEFTQVRQEIEMNILEEMSNEKLGAYIEQLKKESYIKIYKSYPEK